MRGMLLLLLCTSLSALPARAADEPIEVPVSGLEFGLPSNLGVDDFGLEEVDGYDFSWTRRTSASRGWRIGTSIYLVHDSDDDDSGAEYTDYWVFDSQERDRDLVRLTLRVQKLFVSEPRHGVSLVLGIGPVLGYEYSSTMDRNRREYVPDDPEDDSFPDLSDRTIERNSDRVWAGAAWDAGVEWRVSRQFTVGARYQWSATYGMTDQETRYIDEGELVRTVDANGSDFGLDSGSVDLIATFWY